MTELNNDVLPQVTNKLSYLELLNFSMTCKKYMEIQVTDDYKNKKKLYHNPNEDNILIFCSYDSYISMNNVNICVIRKAIDNFEFIINQNIFTMLGYPYLKLDYKFPDILLKKIIHRFRSFKINRLIYVNGTIFPFVINGFGIWNSCGNMNDSIEQIKLLYYALKYYKNDIICSFG